MQQLCHLLTARSWQRCLDGLSLCAARTVGMHVLDMGNNSMTAEGAASLAAYMETHRELKDLNLYMNDIGSAGLEKVPSACCLIPWR